MKPLDIYLYLVGVVQLTACAVGIFAVKRYLKKHPPEKKQAGEDRPAD